jgi:integrase/recombinase XerD
MRDADDLARWDTAVAAYLNSRHAVGRGYVKEEWILGRVRDFLVRAGASDLDAALFDRWRSQFYRRSSSTRVAYEYTVFNFCRYRRRRDPDCFLPDHASLPRQKSYRLPTIIEPQQVAQLLKCVSDLHAVPSSRYWMMRASALRLAVVLLYTAGLRRGEVVRLTLADVDSAAGVLRIRESKFHKSRWVPLSASATAELRRYLEARHLARLDERAGAPLLCTSDSRPYSGNGLLRALKRRMAAAGIHDSAGRVPRVQDFRHSFAVAALLRWYEADADAQANLPRLALYMGHVSIASTAYYLRWMPAIVARASDRFARACSGVIDGGVR